MPGLEHSVTIADDPAPTTRKPTKQYVETEAASITRVAETATP